VQITAAPLWPLFRHGPWQRVLKDTWQTLQRGDDDWARLAMHYWPERVRGKCRTDHSRAIAHGWRRWTSLLRVRVPALAARLALVAPLG
jgi:hypothetical protein